MKKLLFLILFFIIAANAEAQSDSLFLKKDSVSLIKRNNSIIVELLGAGLLYSVNYERTLFKFSSVRITGQIGITYYGEYVPLPTFSCNQVYGYKRNSFETGFGFGYVGGHFRFGYRYENEKNGFVFRAAFMPLVIHQFSFSGDGSPEGYWMWPWLGISFGKSF